MVSRPQQCSTALVWRLTLAAVPSGQGETREDVVGFTLENVSEKIYPPCLIPAALAAIEVVAMLLAGSAPLLLLTVSSVAFKPRSSLINTAPGPGGVLVPPVIQ